MCAGRGGGLSREIQELVTHFVVTCNNEASVAAAKSATYVEVRRASVAFIWGLGGLIS